MPTRPDYEESICRRLRHANPVPKLRKVFFKNGDGPKVSECHPNVDRWVGEHLGATAVRGWVTHQKVWDGHNFKQELTAHSVVRAADGQLFDITPFSDERVRDTTLFVPHPGDEELFLLMRGSNIRCCCGQQEG